MHTLQKRGLLFNKVVPSKTVSSAYTDQYICWQQNAYQMNITAFCIIICIDEFIHGWSAGSINGSNHSSMHYFSSSQLAFSENDVNTV